MLKKFLLTSTFIVLIYFIFITGVNKVYGFSLNKNNSILSSDNLNIKYIDKKEDTSIGSIYIHKINLNKNLFSINDSRNNIDENVTILNGSILPGGDNSILFIAAHSGTGPKAYFNNLKYLEENDSVYINLYNVDYKYEITEIKEVEKTGYITGNRKYNHEIILTTCSDNKGKQLIIYGKLKSN